MLSLQRYRYISLWAPVLHYTTTSGSMTTSDHITINQLIVVDIIIYSCLHVEAQATKVLDAWNINF